MNLTRPQYEALQAYATKHGTHWKSKLKTAWLTGRDIDEPRGNQLRQVRNLLGPAWLTKFKLETPTNPA